MNENWLIAYKQKSILGAILEKETFKANGILDAIQQLVESGIHIRNIVKIELQK